MALDKKSQVVVAELMTASKRLQWASTSIKKEEAGEERDDNVSALLEQVEASVKRAREAWAQ